MYVDVVGVALGWNVAPVEATESVVDVSMPVGAKPAAGAVADTV